jgi:hypothetical protein
MISECEVKEGTEDGFSAKEIMGDIERRELNTRDWKDMNKLRVGGRERERQTAKCKVEGIVSRTVFVTLTRSAVFINTTLFFDCQKSILKYR